MAEGQGRSSRQELKLLYLRDYFYKYTNSDNPKRMKEILKHLEVNGIPASRVTVYNDIEILRNTLHIPIKYSAKHYGYYVEKPQLESHEMLMLLDCIRFSTFITEEETERLRQKVMTLASVYDSELVNNMAPEETHVLKAKVSVYDNLRILLDAIRRKKKIRYTVIDYVANRSYSAKPMIGSFIASPHRLALENGTYILYLSLDRNELIQTIEAVMPPDTKGLWDSMIKNMQNLYQKMEVSHLSEIQILDAPSIYAENPKLDTKQESEEALDEMFGSKRAITLWFSNDILDRAALDLGKDVILQPVGKEGFETTIRRRADNTFFKWVDSLGGKAKILAPADVVEKYSKRKNK